MTTYLIDAYNLLHRVYPEFLENASLEEARDRLEDEIARFHMAAGSHRIVVIFDGQSGPGGSTTSRSGFQVRFSRAPQSADDLILDMVRQLEGREDVVVVTSDLKDIGYRISGLRCRHESSEEFGRRLQNAVADKRPGKGPGGSTDKPTIRSEQETDAWLREFEMHPEDDEI